MHCLTLKVGDRFTVREDQERLRDLWYACERAHGFPPTSTITQLEESWGWHNNWTVNTWNLQLLASYCYPTFRWSEVFSTNVSRNAWTNAKLPSYHWCHLILGKLAKNDSWMFTVIVIILWLGFRGDFPGSLKYLETMDYQIYWLRDSWYGTQLCICLSYKHPVKFVRMYTIYSRWCTKSGRQRDISSRLWRESKITILSCYQNKVESKEIVSLIVLNGQLSERRRLCTYVVWYFYQCGHVTCMNFSGM